MKLKRIIIKLNLSPVIKTLSNKSNKNNIILNFFSVETDFSLEIL